MASTTKFLRLSLVLVFCAAAVIFRFLGERSMVQEWRKKMVTVQTSAAATTADENLQMTTTNERNDQNNVSDNANNTSLSSITNIRIPTMMMMMTTTTTTTTVDSKTFKSLLFHIGKAGGTSTTRHLIEDWKIRLQECHPRPCHDLAVAGKDGGRYTLINIRDPVDRFVSGFYYSIQRTCKPWQKPSHGCTYKKPNEIYITHTRYQKNATLLAEDLCSPNVTVAQIAHGSLRNITHLTHGIPEWLDFEYKPEKLFPLVVEPGALGLEAQIDTAMEWLYEKLHYETPEKFANRHRRVKGIAAKRKKIDQHYKSSAPSKRNISATAESCLEQYYRSDYQMLQTLLQQGACKTDHCRQAIQSILKRRYKALAG